MKHCYGGNERRKRKNKKIKIKVKSQAAMEYLMKYAWAILIINGKLCNGSVGDKFWDFDYK
ncbi:MAG: hypothetical protein ACP5H9_05225, partial [Candidatus Woesearchaeota archaeon]